MATRAYHNGHQGVTDPADVGIDGHQQVGIAVGLVGAVSELFIDLMEIFHGRLLVAEDLDHLLAVQHFLNKSVHCAQVDLLAHIIFPG